MERRLKVGSASRNGKAVGIEVELDDVFPPRVFFYYGQADYFDVTFDDKLSIMRLICALCLDAGGAEMLGRLDGE